MNKNRLSILCLFIVIDILLGDILPDDRTPPWEYPFLQRGEVDINIKTEKAKYCLGELITLEVEICNLTDRKIAIVDIHNEYMRYFGVEVTAPYQSGKSIRHKNGDGIDLEDINRKSIDQKINPQPVPRTLLGKLAKEEQPFIRFKDYTIPPHGKLKYRIPLSMNFDFSTAEYGEYTASINCDLLKWHRRNYVEPRKELVIKKNCTFELHRGAITSISRMTADYMREALGREKAIEVLCDEAEALINEFKGMKEEEWKKSSEYERLRRILAASCWASDIHHIDENLDYLDEHNLMRLEEFEKLVQRCRAITLSESYEEAEELLSSLNKMDNGKWKESVEYSRLRKLLKKLCKAAELGYEEKNLDYLEKNNNVGLDELDDLLDRCNAKLNKMIPYY